MFTARVTVRFVVGLCDFAEFCGILRSVSVGKGYQPTRKNGLKSCF